MASIWRKEAADIVKDLRTVFLRNTRRASLEKEEQMNETLLERAFQECHSPYAIAAEAVMQSVCPSRTAILATPRWRRLVLALCGRL